MHHQGLWIDVGTPERLAQVDALAEREIAERGVC
jgi:NDP-sugar pyrophosphorylase family protein